MKPYAMPEYAAFVATMRADPSDRVAPLVCADWLEEHGKGDHARFVRGCVEVERLSHNYRRKGWGAEAEGYSEYGRIQDLYGELRPLINRHCHEWTAGWLRKFDNPTPHDFPGGFLRSWFVFPMRDGSDRECDPNALEQLRAILKRQPIHTVHVQLPQLVFAPPSHHVNWLSMLQGMEGVTFRHGHRAALRQPKESVA